MIVFENLEFNRVIIHSIIQKDRGQDTATADLDNHLLKLSDEIAEIIKDRLAKAAMKNSKAFILEVEDSSSASFYGVCKKLMHLNDEKFIDQSGEIANLLAEAQTRNSIPGGYLIIIEAKTNKLQSVYIAIKAELHEALRYEWTSDYSRLKLLEDVFLSPTMKLYKVGMIYQLDGESVDPAAEPPNDKWGCFLFDNQFTPDSKPAEYFYKDFLGFSISNNPKIQSKKFYENTEKFIHENVEDFDEKMELIKGLKQEFIAGEDLTVNPNAFSDVIFNQPEVKDKYAAEVSSNLPEYVVKDTSMFKSQLEWKKIKFPNKVNISGPDNTFDYSVKIINSKDELDNIDPVNDNYTILKVLGKPFAE